MNFYSGQQPRRCAIALCHQCGSSVDAGAEQCGNCGAVLNKRTARRRKRSTKTLRQMTQRVKALDMEGRLLPPNEIIADRFKVGRQIGDGPFGQVFEAEDQLIESEVAIKVFFEELMETPVEEENFLKATRRARALTQKNVVRLHDSGLHGDLPWVSMQYLDGLNLQKVAGLRQQRGEGFSLNELEPIVAQLTLALQHVQRDSTHGNLKPTNVVVLPEVVKLTDSYLTAALPRDAVSERLQENPFIAPELRRGADFDQRADVYSLGRIIGFMVFGEDYEPGSEPDAPGALSAVDKLCTRATQESPDERYSSVEALTEDFTSVVDTGMLMEQGGASSVVIPANAIPASPTEKTKVVQRLPERGDANEAQEPRDEEPDAPEPLEEAQVEDEPEVLEEAPVEEAPVEDSQEVHKDPLDVETPADIGMPREDDLETAEFDRESHAPELGDMLPTNEVDRSTMEGINASKADRESPAEPKGTSEPAKPQPSPKAPPSPKPPKPPRAQSETDSKGGPLAILAVLAVVGVVVLGLGLWMSGSDETVDTDDIDADADIFAEAISGFENAIRDARQEADRITADHRTMLQERQQVVEQASAVVVEARSTALDAAETRAEELEEETEEAVAEGTGSATGAAAGPSGGAPAQEATPECPPGMVTIQVGGETRCIDQYQYPGRGRLPQVNVSWFDANSLCGQNDKRLCSLEEWRAACGSTYPYGASFDPDRCNTADADGFPRDIAEAGDFPQCRSPSGAFDMSGNVFEWVEEEQVVGGDYDSRADNASCNYASGMARTASRGNVGFRCCATPE